MTMWNVRWPSTRRLVRDESAIVSPVIWISPRRTESVRPNTRIGDQRDPHWLRYLVRFDFNVANDEPLRFDEEGVRTDQYHYPHGGQVGRREDEIVGIDMHRLDLAADASSVPGRPSSRARRCRRRTN